MRPLAPEISAVSLLRIIQGLQAYRPALLAKIMPKRLEQESPPSPNRIATGGDSTVTLRWLTEAPWADALMVRWC